MLYMTSDLVILTTYCQQTLLNSIVEMSEQLRETAGADQFNRS